MTVREDVIRSAFYPSYNLHQVAHKSWNVTSQYSSVAHSNKFVVHFHGKSLFYNCFKKNKKKNRKEKKMLLVCS